MEAIVPSGVTRRKRGSDHSGAPVDRLLPQNHLHVILLVMANKIRYNTTSPHRRKEDRSLTICNRRNEPTPAVCSGCLPKSKIRNRTERNRDADRPQV